MVRKQFPNDDVFFREMVDAFTGLRRHIHLAVEQPPQNTPPGSPSPGDAYLVGGSPTGSWSGEADAVAIWESGISWTFHYPDEGWTAWVKSEDIIYGYDGSTWSSSGAGASASKLGIENLLTQVNPTNQDEYFILVDENGDVLAKE